MPINKLSKYFFSRDQLLLPLGVLFFLSAGILNLKIEKPVLELSKQDTALNINKDLLILMSAGNKRLITDLLWVQTLIESDLEHYSGKDFNNWLFLRFNAISILDPYFYENYLYGGKFLAIVKDDLEGADYIYEKGIKHFSTDYDLIFNAGFLNYYEIGNLKKGLQLLKRIESHPKAPVFIRSIINKLSASLGADLTEIFKLVLYNYESAKDEKLKGKLWKDLYALKAEIDINCLNLSTDKNCSMVDLDGNPYFKKGTLYETLAPFVKYRIKTRQK